jgi:DNA processing protein
MGDPRNSARLADWLILRHCTGLSDRAALALFRRLGSVAQIAEQDARALRDAGLTEHLIHALQSADRTRLDDDLAWARSPGRGLLCWEDPGYPAVLRDIADPPTILYHLGDTDLLAGPALAIVGSRNPTPDGERNAYAFAKHLAGSGLNIVSGLAAGIDTAAHRGALDAGGVTIAVLGTGADIAYPASNTDLMAQIAERGVVLSEFAPGTAPQRDHFPRRNRLISGLSAGTLVVEAARQSGSLITARLAGEQGREVFAMPGSIHNPMARGCHRLLRQGAKLVESADDILSELTDQLAAWLKDDHGPHPRSAESEAAVELVVANDGQRDEQDPDYRKLNDALGDAPVTMDELSSRSGLTTDVLSSMLLIMELEGQVSALPGGSYVRITARSDT